MSRSIVTDVETVISALNNKADIELENSSKAAAIESLASSAASAAQSAATVAHAANELIETQMPLKLDKSGGGIQGNLSVSGDLFVGGTINASISGTSENAVKASQDAQGNVIDEHYATKSEVNTKNNEYDSILNSAISHGQIGQDIIGKVNINLNDILEPGHYYVYADNPTNAINNLNYPLGVNYFMDVYRADQSLDSSDQDSIVGRQILYRVGHVDDNDDQIYTRSFQIYAHSPNTIVFGTWKRLNVGAKDNSDFIIPYKQGDVLNISSVIVGGYITNGGKDVLFTIPLNKPYLSSSINIISGEVFVRQNNNYPINGDDISNYEITTYIRPTGISVRIRATTSLTSVNNDSCGVHINDCIIEFN